METYNFDNTSSRMEPKRAREFFFNDEFELFLSKKQAIEEASTIKPESRINLSDALPCENPFGSPSTPFENDTSVGLSFSFDMENQETGVSDGGFGNSQESVNGLPRSMDDNGQPYGKEGGNVTLDHFSDTPAANIGSTGSNFKEGVDKNAVSLYDIKKSAMALLESNLSSYSLLYDQPTVLTSKTPTKKDIRIGNALLRKYQSPKSKLESASKNKSETKAAKKEAPNSFPTRVRSLTMTGKLDGMRVRYITSSSEVLLHGIIKGSGYVCGCQSCNYSKTITAIEFERHAGCKTNHPNNHIYLENGKAIYQILQELKNTPLSMLSEVDVSMLSAMNVPNSNAIVSTSPAPKIKLNAAPKTKPDPKAVTKEGKDRFPSNVKSLIMTGMFEGIPVRYISPWQKGVIPGIIKGSGYLCGCQSCKYSKVLNALEFERHAGASTHHQNNHIHFENGKSMHQIVQDLRTTPLTVLFDVIHTVTGSPINEKAFNVWKESMLAANPELQRILGMERYRLVACESIIQNEKVIEM